MVPVAGVVAGPGDGVALATGVAGARHDEGPQVGLQFEQAVVGGARVLHAEDVVDLEMGGGARREAGLVDAVLRVVGHGLRGTTEDGGLVHVVPEAGNALVDEIWSRAMPHQSRGCFAREVGEDGFAGPHDADIDGAVGILDEVVARGAFVVGFVAGVGQIGDVQVGDEQPCGDASALRSWIIWSKWGKRSGSTVKGRFLS